MTHGLLNAAFGSIFSSASDQPSPARLPKGREAARDALRVLAHELSDEILVARIRNGDRDAFDSLVVRYHARLVATTEAALGVRSEAEDLVQGMLLRVWIQRQTWEPSQGAAAYLFGSAANRVRNVWRDRKRAQRSLDRILREQRVDHDPGIVAEDIADVWEFVAKLPERWRTALLLRYLRDATFAEVGASMQISENAAKKLVQRALSALNAELSKK